jgi:hypothetical protein
MEQPEPQKETPVTPEEALEWKSDELPAWLKEITESAESEEAPVTMEVHPAEEAPVTMEVHPAEEAPVTMEVHPAEETPAPPVEPTSERPEEIVTTSIETDEKALEAPRPETGPWVPEVEEPVQPVSIIPVEVEAVSAPALEELTTKAVEITPPAPPEEAVPMEMVSEVDKAALVDARNAINQGQSSQAVGFYTGLIKHNYHLDEIIKDLQDALYRFPVDVDMWVALGDAHYRSDDLQEALNAYTKAEELIR